MTGDDYMRGAFWISRILPRDQVAARLDRIRIPEPDREAALEFLATIRAGRRGPGPPCRGARSRQARQAEDGRGVPRRHLGRGGRGRRGRQAGADSKRSEGPAKLREAEAERNVQVLTQAAHRTAERVTQAIVETRDSWIIDLEQREAEAADQFREALAELTTAAHTFRATRGATAWLSDVDVERGVLPLQVSDGALSVPVGASRNGIGGGQSRNSGGGRRVGPPKGVG